MVPDSDPAAMMTNVAPSGIPNGERKAIKKKKR
jgi:hypothetical protein